MTYTILYYFNFVIFKTTKGKNVAIKNGNSLPLNNIPVGTSIHNIELKPGAGGQLIRSAGSSAQIVSKELPYVQIKLISGEIRHINNNCRATTPLTFGLYPKYLFLPAFPSLIFFWSEFDTSPIVALQFLLICLISPEINFI